MTARAEEKREINSVKLILSRSKLAEWRHVRLTLALDLLEEIVSADSALAISSSSSVFAIPPHEEQRC